MKSSNIFNLIVTSILLPLWLDIVKHLIEQISWLYYTVAGILTLLTAYYLFLTICDLRIKLDSHFNFQRKRMDRLVLGTRKKLQRIIARTGDASVMDYALKKLREICPSEDIYSDIITDISKKERDPEKQKSLFGYKNLRGEYHEN